MCDNSDYLQRLLSSKSIQKINTYFVYHCDTCKQAKECVYYSILSQKLEKLSCKKLMKDRQKQIVKNKQKQVNDIFTYSIEPIEVKTKLIIDNFGEVIEQHNYSFSLFKNQSYLKLFTFAKDTNCTVNCNSDFSNIIYLNTDRNNLEFCRYLVIRYLKTVEKLEQLYTNEYEKVTV